jgi:hypothetical protein
MGTAHLERRSGGRDFDIVRPASCREGAAGSDHLMNGATQLPSRHLSDHQALHRQGRNEMRFHTTILQGDKTATGIHIPDEVIETLGAGKRPPITVTINGFTYRSTVAVMDGRYMVGVSAENRAGARVAGGDEVDVDIELDTAPREVALPADFAAALDAEPAARRMFDGLSNSNKGWHVYQIEGAKTDETRQRRIGKSIDALREGRVR